MRDCTGSNVVAGFKATGIVPFNPNCISAKSYEAASALSYGRTDTTHEEATPIRTSIPSAITLGPSRDEGASLDTSVEVTPCSISASTPNVKKFFLKRLKVHDPSGGACRLTLNKIKRMRYAEALTEEESVKKYEEELAEKKRNDEKRQKERAKVREAKKTQKIPNAKRQLNLNTTAEPMDAVKENVRGNETGLEDRDVVDTQEKC